MIFNKEAVNLVLKYFPRCIKADPMQWYDYSIMKCIENVIAASEYSAVTPEQNMKVRCDILQMESSMNCCYNQLYCDPALYDHFVVLSWFERFRLASGFHYIKGRERYETLRSSIPERFFNSNGKKEFCFSKEQLLDDFLGISVPKKKLEQSLSLNEIIARHELITKPQIDWSVKESDQKDPSSVHLYMEQLHALIFNHWENQRTAERSLVENLQSNSDMDVVIIPSSSLEEFSNRIGQDYDPIGRLSEAESYWRGSLPTTNVHPCRTTSNTTQKEAIYECLKLAEKRETKWVLVVTESTRADLPKIKKYLSTFSSRQMYYVSSFGAAQEVLLSKKELSLPFASGFVVSRPFLDGYVEMGNVQSRINTELLIPNKIMVLSGGHFFLHAPEYYCSKGIQNLKSWIEMKLKPIMIEPFLVTFSPTNNCKTRWSSITNFFNNVHHSVAHHTALKESCFD